MAGDNVVPFAVGADWGPGAYAVALTHRPLDVAARRMPGRAIGLAWFGIARGSAQARRRLRGAGARAAARADDRADQGFGPRARRRGAGDRVGGRHRHPQSDRLQDAGPERLFLRPAQAAGRDPRPLGHADRRHAGRGGRDPCRRRRERQSRRQPADPAAARALFRRGEARRRGQGDGDVRSAGVQRRRAARRRRLVEGQGRLRRGRRHRARLGRRRRDAAALPRRRRPVADACRDRQRRGRSRRLHARPRPPGAAHGGRRRDAQDGPSRRRISASRSRCRSRRRASEPPLSISG